MISIFQTMPKHRGRRTGAAPGGGQVTSVPVSRDLVSAVMSSPAVSHVTRDTLGLVTSALSGDQVPRDVVLQSGQ